jgi:hypothetical protein
MPGCGCLAYVSPVRCFLFVMLGVPMFFMLGVGLVLSRSLSVGAAVQVLVAHVCASHRLVCVFSMCVSFGLVAVCFSPSARDLVGSSSFNE